jgi:hypothetical protein
METKCHDGSNIRQKRSGHAKAGLHKSYRDGFSYLFTTVDQELEARWHAKWTLDAQAQPM